MPKPFDIRTYMALRGLLGPFACWILLIAALFGAHTPSAGYDDDDPNRVALVADFPRLALTGVTLRRAAVEATQALVRPLDRPLAKPAGPAAAAAAPRLVAGRCPVSVAAMPTHKPAARRHPARSARAPPALA